MFRNLCIIVVHIISVKPKITLRKSNRLLTFGFSENKIFVNFFKLFELLKKTLEFFFLSKTKY